MKSKSSIALIALISLLAVMLVPVMSLDSTAVSENDIKIISSDEDIGLSAGSSTSFEIVVSNYLTGGQDLDNQRAINIKLKADNDGIYASASKSFFIIGEQSYETLTINVYADKFTSTGKYVLTISLDIRPLNSESTDVVTLTYDVAVEVSSHLSAGSAFNKILGIFENPLPAPFNNAAVSAVITFILWMVIGIAAILVIVPILVHIIMHGKKTEKTSVKRGIEKLLSAVVLLYALTSSLRVLGASESVISTFETWCGIFYVLLGAIIIWKLYTAFISFSLSKIHNELITDEEAEVKGSNLEPLFRLLGKVLITVVAMASVMASLGFDMGAIITSAGVVSLGITLGAQNVLNQFFSGVVILLTRPFKTGDLILIGNNTTTYRVLQVNVMNTTFENWANDETIVMPNNSVASASITNITGRDLTYKIHVYMSVAYGTDLTLAKKIALDIGMNHPDVVIDGTVDLPYTRAYFEDSSINIRLTAFVRDYNDYGTVSAQLAENIYNAYLKAGIEIPYPQMDVHVDYADSEKKP